MPCARVPAGVATVAGVARVAIVTGTSVLGAAIILVGAFFGAGAVRVFAVKEVVSILIGAVTALSRAVALEFELEESGIAAGKQHDGEQPWESDDGTWGHGGLASGREGT